jgi:hypothetical protein
VLNTVASEQARKMEDRLPACLAPAPGKDRQKDVLRCGAMILKGIVPVFRGHSNTI